MTRFALLGFLAAFSCAPTALEVGRDHPAHPDAPAPRAPAASAMLAVDAGLDSVVSQADAGESPHAHHHHHGGGSPP